MRRTKVKYRFIADLKRFLYCFGVTMAARQKRNGGSVELERRVENGGTEDSLGSCPFPPPGKKALSLTSCSIFLSQVKVRM